MPKKRRKWPYILIGTVVIAAVVVVALDPFMWLKRASAQVYSTHEIGLGYINSYISGSGTLKSADTIYQGLPTDVKVESVDVRLGDAVAQGQELAVFARDSLNDKAAQLSTQIASTDQQLAQLANSKQIETITSPAKGRVKYLPAQEGDEVSDRILADGALAILSSDGLMRVSIDRVSEIAISTDVSVKVGEEEYDGQVAGHDADKTIITLKDNKAPYLEAAQVYDEDGTLLGEGVLEINAPIAVYALGGMVSDVHCKIDAQVQMGTKLFTLNNGAYTDSYQQAYKQRIDLEAQLTQVIAYIADPTIYASDTGVISILQLEQGQKTQSAPASATTQMAGTAAVSADSGLADLIGIDIGGATKLLITIDELDIHRVHTGMQAQVALDAITGASFNATIEHISNLGSVQGKLTTYEVQLTLEYDERMYHGMNASVTILADSAQDVVCIPVELISEDENGEFVYLQQEEGGERQRRDIKTGVSDGVLAQVLEGLNVGEKVLYQQAGENGLTALMPNAPMGGERWQR